LQSGSVAPEAGCVNPLKAALPIYAEEEKVSFRENTRVLKVNLSLILIPIKDEEKELAHYVQKTNSSSTTAGTERTVANVVGTIAAWRLLSKLRAEQAYHVRSFIVALANPTCPEYCAAYSGGLWAYSHRPPSGR
jgi:hypothetical protein